VRKLRDGHCKARGAIKNSAYRDPVIPSFPRNKDKCRVFFPCGSILGSDSRTREHSRDEDPMGPIIIPSGMAGERYKNSFDLLISVKYDSRTNLDARLFGVICPPPAPSS